HLRLRLAPRRAPLAGDARVRRVGRGAHARARPRARVPPAARATARAMSPALVAALVVVALYAAAVLALVLAGRRADAAALARFAPDCAVLLGRLARDPRLSRPRRALLALAVLYLASPVDLVPDFVPVAGQLDDVVIVVLLLRGVLR